MTAFDDVRQGLDCSYISDTRFDMRRPGTSLKWELHLCGLDYTKYPLEELEKLYEYKEIEPEQVYGVWEEIRKNLDYENGQWKNEVLDYVFAHGPKSKNLPLNGNGKVTVYRGSGTLSQSPERALL